MIISAKYYFNQSKLFFTSNNNNNIMNVRGELVIPKMQLLFYRQYKLYSNTKGGDIITDTYFMEFITSPMYSSQLLEVKQVILERKYRGFGLNVE